MAVSKTSDLLSLLSICAPNNDVLRHECLKEQIISLESYQELANMNTYKEVYDNYFTLDILDAMDNAKLLDVKNLMPTLIRTLQDVVFSLKNGEASKLMSQDAPDFYSIESLRCLQSKLMEGGCANYTNIQPENFMMIFSTDVVKSGLDAFNGFDENTTDFESELDKLYKNRYYCISKNEISEYEERYKSLVNSVRTERSNGFKQGLRRFIKKLTFVVLAFLILWFISSSTQLINSEMNGVASIMIAIISVVFLIGG